MPDSWTPPADLRIDEFRLERRLGRGATSEVWLARDALLDRVVALKIANAVASTEMRARFRVEARAVAKLQHPNLLTIHHVGEVGERPFLVTEFLAGHPLDDLTLPLAAEEVVAIGVDLARGLSAAHHAGVLHRDIKPANAFLCDDGAAKLLDFGLAKLGGEPAGLADSQPIDASLTSSEGALDATQLESTLSGRLAGTPLYMAPETWRGEPATRRTDIYSLGALLYELLAGRPAFAAQSMHELRAKILAGRFAPLGDVAPHAPADLAALITRCLHAKGDDRPLADELCDALVRIAAPRTSVVAEALDDPATNPYRGLLTFGPEHRALFFGREAETAAIVAELRSNPFVLVAGVSGTGKSSLVRAGVVPRVERGALAPGAAWNAPVVVPGARPTEALAQAVGPLLGVGEAEIVGALAQSRDWLADELSGRRARVLLVVDQLEEIWTLAAPRERAAFFEILAAIVRSAPTVRIVATLRADFLGRLDDTGEIQGPALRGLYVLRPMTPEGLRRAIVEPAERRGVAIEPALVDRLVGHDEGGSLPLLEFALGELYARRDAAKGSIGLADLDALGGVEGALATHADSTLARLPSAQRAEARRLLLSLVTVERTRWRREERELVGPEGATARAALGALVDARLVVASAGDGGSAYEIAHEALLSGWPTLRAWLDEESAAREAAARLSAAAREWTRLGRGAEGLGGERLLREVSAAFDAADDDARAFIVASREALRRARVKARALRLGVPIGVALVVLAIAATLRWSERRQTRGFVAARLAEARGRMHDVSDLDADVARARADAFARFDEGDAKGGEAAWHQELALARRESEALAAASGPLGLALARDPLSPEARAASADLALVWLRAAERDHDADVARDLATRLAEVDDGGRRRALLAAPARLDVSTVPPGANVVLFTVHADESGRYVRNDERPVDPGAPIALAPGAYHLVASADGWAASSYPLRLSAGEERRVAIPLVRAGDVPPGFVFVPAGRSLLGAADVEGVRTAMLAEPEHAVDVGAFFVGEHEVTFSEYLVFLAALAPAERVARRPHAAGVDLAFDAKGVAVVTLGAATARQGEPLCRARRSVRRCQDWARMPVAGVSWDDARAYAAWLSRGAVPGARLCTDREWERAARGADGRLYPGGDVLFPDDANIDATYGKDDDQGGTDEVGSYARDVSPFGVFDMAGNVAEWVGSDAAGRAARGGRWIADAFGARAAYRHLRLVSRYGHVGIRVCADAPGAR